MSDEAVYRTAPATPGLLIIFAVCVVFGLGQDLKHVLPFANQKPVIYS